MVLIENQIVRVKAVNLVSATTGLPAPVRTLSSATRNGAPLSLQIYGIDNTTRSREFIYLLRDLIASFELQSVVTGAKMNYDVKRCKLMKYGFINFLTRAHLEYYHESHLEFRDEHLSCQISEKIQLLMEPVDLELLSRGNPTWSNSLKRANKLIGLRPDPSPEVVPVPAVEAVPAVEPALAVKEQPTVQDVAGPSGYEPTGRPCAMKRRAPVETKENDRKKIKILSVVTIPPPSRREADAVREDEDVLDINLDALDLE
jgi:hypothetical protein